MGDVEAGSHRSSAGRCDEIGHDELERDRLGLVAVHAVDVVPHGEQLTASVHLVHGGP